MSFYNDLDAQILAISVDSHFALKLWKEKQNYKFPLLTDFNKEVCKKYYAYYDVFVPGIFDYEGVAKRSAFVIDKEGIVRYSEVLDNGNEEPNYEAVKEALNALN